MVASQSVPAGYQPSHCLAFRPRHSSPRHSSLWAQAAQIFGGLDVSTDGVLNRSEFSKSLGIMGTSNSVLSNFIFDVRKERSSGTWSAGLTDRLPGSVVVPCAQAIDTDRNNELSFAEFVEFLLTVSIGTRDDKLDFGFRLMDLDKNGVITKVRCVSAPCVG